MGRGPARPIKFSDHGPRFGPTHQISTRWAAARPGPSIFQNFSARPSPAQQIFKTLGSARPGAPNFQNTRPGRARPIKKIHNSRPGPAHHIFIFFGRARPGPSHFQISRPGPAWPALWAHDVPCIKRRFSYIEPPKIAIPHCCITRASTVGV